MRRDSESLDPDRRRNCSVDRASTVAVSDCLTVRGGIESVAEGAPMRRCLPLFLAAVLLALPPEVVLRRPAGAREDAAADARPAAAQPGADPAAVLRLPHRDRRRARALSEDPRVLPAPLEDDQPDQVPGARQDDDGESVRAGDDQRAGEPREAGEARRDQQTARGSAGPVRGGSEEAGAGRPGLLSGLRDDSLDRGRQHAGAHRGRAPAGDRQRRRDPADARQCRAARRAVTESRRSGPRRRSLVQDEGHALRARIPRPLSQVRRTRRQPRLVHVHADRDTARGGEGPQRVQTDHHARHAPAGGECVEDLRAAVRRSVRPERAPDSRAGHHERGQRHGRRRSWRKERRGSSTCRGTISGRRRGSTWSTTASRAS